MEAFLDALRGASFGMLFSAILFACVEWHFIAIFLLMMSGVLHLMYGVEMIRRKK